MNDINAVSGGGDAGGSDGICGVEYMNYKAYLALNAKVTELTEKLAAAEALNNFDATRLRRLVSFCGVACPDSDDELLHVAGVVIGSCLRVLPTMLAKERQAGRNEYLKELSEQEPDAWRITDGEGDYGYCTDEPDNFFGELDCAIRKKT